MGDSLRRSTPCKHQKPRTTKPNLESTANTTWNLHATARGKVKGKVKRKVKTNAKGEKHRKDEGKGMANAEKGKIAQATLGRSGDEHSAVCEVPPSRRLYIGNISTLTSIAELYDIFDGTKKPNRLTIHCEAEFKVYAFASFKTLEAARSGLEQIKGMILDERKLAVYFAWDGALMKDEAEEP